MRMVRKICRSKRCCPANILSNREAQLYRKMISLPLKFFVSALLICLLISGCGTQLVKSLRDLRNLQTLISEKFGDKLVSVNLNEESLTVTFINSPLNSSSVGDRRRRAQETAQFIKEHYSSVNTLAAIWVGFIRQERQFVFVTTNYSMGYFGFDHDAHSLDLNKSATRSNDSAKVDLATSGFQPAAVYDSRRDQTTISIPTLVLTGNDAEGLAAALHFTVAGNANGVKRAPPPQFVSIDRGSTSRTQRDDEICSRVTAFLASC